MNILFLTIGRMESIEARSIYPDLLREFRNNGHSVYIVSQHERRTGLSTELVEDNGAKVLYVKIGNITKCNFIEKGISTILLEKQYLSAIKKHYKNVKFDLIMYSTPPITLSGVVKYIKKRDNAKTYLLLKDIFPQNAVDIGLMSKSGIKGLLYKYFRRKEKSLYNISDYIGCMSQANVDYILKHNPEINSSKVEICPNAIDPQDMSVSENERYCLRKKYGIPSDKKVFVYGGNLGKPQGISFLIQCLRSEKDNNDIFFLIAGDGTEYQKIHNFIKDEKQNNVLLLQKLPKSDYDKLVAACDVGMIFLDSRFTIPNFPSRLLSYMQANLPVLAVTDANTDVGKVIEQGKFGFSCLSNDVFEFKKYVSLLSAEDCSNLGKNAWLFLNEHYTVSRSYQIIMRHF